MHHGLKDSLLYAKLTFQHAIAIKPLCISIDGAHTCRSAFGVALLRLMFKLYNAINCFFIQYQYTSIILPLVIERIIQRRISDSVDFDRDWHDYVNGFGDVDGNFWLGLEAIHQLTSHGVGLDIDIETFEGEPFTLKLETFHVGNGESNYTWHFSGESQSSDRVKNTIFYGGSQDAMFSTRDRDNDIRSSGSCASDVNKGGWWYADCTRINPNGIYEGDVTLTGTGVFVWYIDTETAGISPTKAVQSIEMTIRTHVE